MSKLTRILSMVLCLALAISLCACGGDATKTSGLMADDESEHVTLKWYISKTQPEGFEEVMAAANEYLNEKLNVTLDLQCVESADYDSKVQLALAANEEFDIVWTSNWKNKYEPNVTKGAFIALDEYLELPELAELKDYYSDGIWGAATVANKIYGVPVEQAMFDQPGITFIKETLEKYDLVDAARNIQSKEDIEDIFQTVRDGEPENFYITFNPGLNHFREYATTVNDYRIVDGEIEDTTEFDLANAKRSREWYEKGFFPKEVATMLDQKTSLKNQKMIFSDYNRYLPGSEGKSKLSLGYEVVHTATREGVLNREGVQSTLNAISITSKHPVRALKLLNLLLHDEYLLNLLCYGIEGRDYQKDPENPKRMLERDDGSAYYIGEYMIGSQFLAYLAPSYEDGVWEETKAANEAAIVDENIEFSFDPTPVESEISQCSAITAEYEDILNYGLSADYESVYNEKEDKLELAGSQTIKDEIMRQYNEWKASQE